MVEVKPFSFRDRRFQHIVSRCRVPDPAAEARAAAVVQSFRAGENQAFPRESDALESEVSALRPLCIDDAESVAARAEMTESFLTALSLARVGVRRFHEYQRRQGYVHDDGDGVRLSRRVLPLARVGVCCRSGAAASALSLVMAVVPAQVAGVGEIAVALPPRADGSVDPRLLATAKTLGIDEIYRMGGASAVGVFAFGTESVRRVDKIVGNGGPGGEAAKRLVAGRVGTDATVGPAALVVVADSSANAKFIASDLLAQAETGEDDGGVLLLTTDRLLAEAVRIETERMTDRFADRAPLLQALADRGGIFVCRSLAEALDAANAVAPERLALMTVENDALLTEVENAGAVFLGPWSGQGMGDSLAGCNALMPGGGAARFASGLGVDDFVKEYSVVEYNPDRLLKIGRHMMLLAEAEGRAALAAAIEERMEILRLSGG